MKKVTLYSRSGRSREAAKSAAPGAGSSAVAAGKTDGAAAAALGKQQNAAEKPSS